MRLTGASDDLLVRTRSALLDALLALRDHKDSVVVIGAQAVYLHTGLAPVAVAESTKDCDLVVDPRVLGEDPLIEAAMSAERFYLDPEKNQPGAWMSPAGIPVDLMVPEAVAGSRGRRSASIPPHARNATRWATGLEATVVDNSEFDVTALDPQDRRVVRARVAGPAALLVAKMHKIGERVDNPKRLVDKDAYDVYRLLRAIDTERLGASLSKLRRNDLAGEVTEVAMTYLSELFAAGPQALGSQMAARNEQDLGSPDTVAAACAVLAGDLLVVVNGAR